MFGKRMWKVLFSRGTGQQATPSPRPPCRRARPAVEALEDRAVPATGSGALPGGAPLLDARAQVFTTTDTFVVFGPVAPQASVARAAALTNLVMQSLTYRSSDQKLIARF